jgi:hypothetical protein
MLEVIATAKEDGWAFVKKDEQVFLVKPPYRASNLIPVSEDVIPKAVTSQGFHWIHQEFNDWEGVVASLRAGLKEAHDAVLGHVADADLQRELLEDAPMDILEGYLRRTEEELLPNHEWRAATTVLTVLLKLDSIRNNPDLFRHTVSLLEQASAEISKLNVERTKLTAEGIVGRFPAAAKRYSVGPVVEYMQKVAQAHQVFAVGAA